MMKLDLEYMPHADWSNGFGVLIQVVGTDDFSFTPIQVKGGKFIYSNKLYTPDGVFEAA